MRVITFFTFFVCLLVGQLSAAEAPIYESFMKDFSTSCLSNFTTITDNKRELCSCIGKKHWDLTKTQSNKKDAAPQLLWITNYYSKEKPVDFDESADPYFLTNPSGFDFAFATQCSKQ